MHQAVAIVRLWAVTRDIHSCAICPPLYPCTALILDYVSYFVFVSCLRT